MRTGLLVMLALVAITQAHAAETRYIHDRLIITLRNGPGSDYQLLQTLSSGAALEILDNSGDYARVRTPEGQVGWVQQQYLSDEPIAEHRLAAVEQQRDRLARELALLQQQAAQASGERSAQEELRSRLEGNNKQLRQENQRLRHVAANPAAIDAENAQLKTKTAMLENRLETLSQDNKQLLDRSRKEWFVIGGLAITGGIVMGFVIPKIRWRRDSEWA